MLPTSHNEASPIGFAPSAFAADGEVDEANLFMPDDNTPALDEASLVHHEAIRELDAATTDALIDALLPSTTQANDEGDAVAKELAEVEEIDALELLLQESLQPAREKATLKAAREKMARGGLSKAERADIESKIREWESKLEWDMQANVATYLQQTCLGCDNITSIFTGLMHRQTHKTVRQTQRWVAARVELAAYPNEVAVQRTTAPMCCLCGDDRGYAWAKQYFIGEANG
jgi:hypothetical protein